MSRDIRITPSILNANHEHIHDEIARIATESDFIHLDIMDDIFVPNKTWDFDAAHEIIKKSSAPIDSHLMVSDADSAAPLYAEAGSRSVTFHVEAAKDIATTIKNIQSFQARAAIAFKPHTTISDYRKYIDLADMVLIMTVEPGFGGQSFMESMLPKIAEVRDYIGDRPIWLQVDGGISLATIAQAASAGADTFVAGSAVFNASDPADMIAKLRTAASSVA